MMPKYRACVIQGSPQPQTVLFALPLYVPILLQLVLELP